MARRHSGQIRLDVVNFGNMLNKNWGVGRLVNSQILTSPTADATGALSYRMQLNSGNYITSPVPELVELHADELGRLRDDVELPLHVQLTLAGGGWSRLSPSRSTRYRQSPGPHGPGFFVNLGRRFSPHGHSRTVTP